MSTELLDHAPVPLKWVGPVRVTGNVMEGEQLVPLATYEQPLWPSVGRGAKMSMLVPDGIKATLIDERMSRSVLFEAADAGVALKALREIQAHMHLLQEVVATSSRFARLIDLHAQIAGNLLFLRFELTTGDASGHNMVTLASERLMELHPASLARASLRVHLWQLLLRQEGHGRQRHPGPGQERRHRAGAPAPHRRAVAAIDP